MFTAVSIVRVHHDRDRQALEAEDAAHRAAVRHEARSGRNAIKFMNARLFGIAFSAFLSIASIALFIYPGPELRRRFQGGIQMEVVTSGPADLARDALEPREPRPGRDRAAGIRRRLARARAGRAPAGRRRGANGGGARRSAQAADGARSRRRRSSGPRWWGRRSAASWHTRACCPWSSRASRCCSTSGSASSGHSPSARSQR